MAVNLFGSGIYSCFNCRSPIAFEDDLLSKSFLVKGGGAGFLFSHARNIILGPEKEMKMITGMYKTSDVYCSYCQQVLGWKYLQAYEKDQKFKEGKFVLNGSNLVNENW